MKQVDISYVITGMVTAVPIYDEANRVLVAEGTVLTDRIINKLKEMGYYTICIDTKKTEGILLEGIISDEIKNKASNAIQNLDMPSILESATEIVASICNNHNISFDLLDIRNEKNYQYRHAVTVAELSIAIGKLIRDENNRPLSEDSLRELAVAALLHDIGKRCSDEKVLDNLNISPELKKYTEDMAPIFSYNLLKDNEYVSATTRIAILFHKTDENGKNAPAKVEPNKIHIFAKIIHIADEYDNLISNGKLFGAPISTSEAVEYLMANCDTKFNSDLVRAFVHYVPIYPKGTSVTLSNGMEAIVYENSPGKMTRPKVLLDNGQIIDLFDNPSITIVKEVIDYMNVSEDVKNR